MMRTVVAFTAGLLFGLGLLVSGMANPAKVLNFLDFAGDFDPSLAAVMLGAVAISATGVVVARRMRRPLLDREFHVPQGTTVDTKLIGGAALFGVGWGLAGFCPGPAVVAIPFLNPAVFIFVAAMLAGMAIGRRLTS